MQWILGVKIPDELLAEPGLAVSQNGVGLARDESVQGLWLLKDINGTLVISFDEDRSFHKIALNKSFLLFKLVGENGDEGRRVKGPTRGSYLVIAPEDWERDDELGGAAPVEPEQVCIEGYLAHYFDLGGDTNGVIAFWTEEGEHCKISPYNFSPKLGKKLISNPHVDMGQGLLLSPGCRAAQIY